MAAGRTLEKIVVGVTTPVRVAPAIALAIATGPSLLVAGSLLVNNSSPGILKMGIGIVMADIGAVSTGLGLLWYAGAWAFYGKAKSLMSQPNALRHIHGIVEPNLYHYCSRQAYHAAASNLGFSKEFKRINSEYNGEKTNTWLPGV